jgi:signal transduction histidine kinase/tetratricopeptide (TPR) repeat protein
MHFYFDKLLTIHVQITLAFLLFSVHSYSQNYPDINFKELDKSGIYLKKALEFETKDPDSIIYFANKALEFNLEDTESVIHNKVNVYSNYLIGNAWINKQNYQEAKNTLNKISSDVEGFEDLELKYVYFKDLGVIDYYQENYNNAIINFSKALSIPVSENKKVSVKNNISVVYSRLEQWEYAIQMNKEVVDFYNTTTEDINYSDKIGAYVNLALNLVKENPEQALTEINRAYELAEESNNKDFLIRVGSSKSEILKENKKFEEAIVLTKNMLSLSEELNYKRSYLTQLANLVQIYYESNDYKNAEIYLNKLIEDCEPSYLPFFEKFINEFGIEIYRNTGQYKKALDFADKHIIYKDSLLIKNEDKAYAEFAKKYETEKKIQENELLKKDNQIKELSLSKEKNRRYLLSALAGLILVISIVLYYRYRNKKKVSEILEVKNSTISKQNLELEEANQTKQKFFSIIAHDLINPFNAILGYTSVLEQDYETFNEREKKEFIGIINKYANQNYELTKNLLDWARSQQNKLNLEKKQIDVKKVVNHVAKGYEVLTAKKSITTNITIADDLQIYADENALKTVITNIYNNAIKFSHKGSVINITSFENQESVSIAIKDFGIGMSQEQVDNLFNISKTSSTKGTDNEKGTGFGMLICKELLEMHNAKVTVNSQKNKGTEVVLVFPKQN